MPKKIAKAKNKNGKVLKGGNGAALGIDAADYKSVVLGLIFLKYVSDMFEQVRARVEAEGLDDPEDRDVYLAERVFWVPKEARWKSLQDNAKQESIGNLIDKALESIERDNPSLKGMLPGNYMLDTLTTYRSVFHPGKSREQVEEITGLILCLLVTPKPSRGMRILDENNKNLPNCVGSSPNSAR